ncbi:MAG: hypothetical protein D6E12_09425, partial [Desulfovibrio sp.]
MVILLYMGMVALFSFAVLVNNMSWGGVAFGIMLSVPGFVIVYLTSLVFAMLRWNRHMAGAVGLLGYTALSIWY